MGNTPQSFSELVGIVVGLVQSMIPVVVALALLVFLWGLARFIFHAGDVGAKEHGKQIMFWGSIALFTMVAIWGIIIFFRSSLGF